MINITDSVTLGDSVINDAGYLEAVARTARTGIQQYLGAELGRPDLGVVNVYRDEAEVFSKASLNTFSKIPVTNDHPPYRSMLQTGKTIPLAPQAMMCCAMVNILKSALRLLMLMR